ncbi:MAG: zinc-dependent peptidase [Cyclobacteriaceae bacterium]
MSEGVQNALIAISLLTLYSFFLKYVATGDIYRHINLAFNFHFRHVINRHFIIRKIKPEHKSVLERTFYYYHTLNDKNKELFQKRVQKFIDKKKFIPAGDHNEVTPAMKSLIAASAVQITFGLPGVYLKNFEEIHVYPDFYFSEGMQQFNAGEVHKSGKIFLSWKDFVEGYTDPTNARNLGLHEMAHALRLENMIQNEEYFYFKWDDIQLFNDHTVIESDKILKGEQSLFRPYAASNYHEFFAVLIEVFFEQPKALLAYNHELFHVTKRLLKQNPIDPNKRIR